MWTPTFQPRHPFLMRRTRSDRYPQEDWVSAGQLKPLRSIISIILSSWMGANRRQTEPHTEAIIKGEVSTCRRPISHLSNKLFVPSTQCPEGISCLMTKGKPCWGYTEAVTETQCALSYRSVFSIKTEERKAGHFIFAVVISKSPEKIKTNNELSSVRNINSVSKARLFLCAIYLHCFQSLLKNLQWATRYDEHGHCGLFGLEPTYTDLL